MSARPPIAALRAEIADRGFAMLPGARLAALMGTAGSAACVEAFAASWERLEVDSFMADGGRYRRRRIANFIARAGVPGHIRGAHRPHFQAVVHNTLNGGLDRWFAPVEDAIGASAAVQALLALGRDVADSVKPGQDWFVEMHQFRIEARTGESGLPTPEGSHRDGVDYVLVLLIRRQNIQSGVTTVQGADGADLGSFTLAAPFEAALVDDHRVFHGVTAVEPVDAALPAYRDVLVVTFRSR
jgi:hypothetical protein